jgi:anti-sigma-K factor RskA
MSDPRHDAFADAAAAYALDSLDARERSEFETHLADCAECRADVAAYRRAAGALGAAVAPVAPPPQLKARVIAHATRTADVRAFERAPTTTPRSPRSSALWLAAAASLALHAAVGYYAWTVRAQLATANDLASRAAAYADRLRSQLADARSASVAEDRISAVLSAPDVVRVRLGPAREGFPGLGLAYVSPTRGMWFAGDQLPAAAPGRTYQLWLVLAGQPPINAGLLPLNPRGSVMMVTPSDRPSVPARSEITLAVTDEPAGGSPGPTTPILLAGKGRTE